MKDANSLMRPSTATEGGGGKSEGGRRLRPARRRRKGVATLVVLLLVAIALAVSYATMRTQGTAIHIQQNANLGILARQAAVTGINVALKKMHTTFWAGVDSTLTGSLGSYQGYQVTFTSGDPSLSAADPDYEELPYRVTLLSIGSAADPGDPGRTSTHQIRAVVRLVPRNLGDEPTDWPTMQQYTLYQSKKDSFEVDIPCRIEGRVRVQEKLKVAPHYPPLDSDARSRYLRDLNAMRLDGLSDYRPFDGPVHLPFLLQEPKFIIALAFQLAVTVNNAGPDEAAADWVKPTSLASYQIYDGGPVYTVTQVVGTPENVTLGPDPLTNPLGLFQYSGTVAIKSNVTIRGTLFCDGEIKVEGTSVHFEPVDLPALYGSSAPIRLPVATCRNFKVKPAGGGSLTGLLAVFEEFRVDESLETVQFAITGRVIARRFFIKEREPWKDEPWNERYDDFMDQLGGGIPYFPVWMGTVGRKPEPQITIRPDPNPVDYHWNRNNSYNPVFLPHSDDVSPLDPANPGYRWELVEWTDNP